MVQTTIGYLVLTIELKTQMNRKTHLRSKYLIAI